MLHPHILLILVLGGEGGEKERGREGKEKRERQRGRGGRWYMEYTYTQYSMTGTHSNIARATSCSNDALSQAYVHGQL